MKTIKYIFQATILFILTAMISCDDNKFLEEKPTTFYTIDNAYSSSEQVDQVLISIYYQWRDMRCNSTETTWILDFKGKGTDMYDVANMRLSSSFSDYGLVNPNHSTFNQVYANFYQIISRANLAIYAAELPQISWSSPADKAYALAQARFFRAFAYRNLGELYGGVPIVKETFTSPRYDFTRSTRVETYQFAIDEMEAILSDLPETTAKGGRLVKGAAQHNLSELYLALGIQLESDGKAGEAQSAYTKSINYANQVIDGGTYGLMNNRFGTRANEEFVSINIHERGSESNPVVDTVLFAANHYWDLFQEGNVNYQDGNKECIWAAQIDYDAYCTEDGRSKLLYPRTYGPVLRDVSDGHIVGLLEDIGGVGVSFTNITMYTRDSIYAGKWGDDVRNSDIVFRRRFKGNVPDLPYYRKDIPWDIIYNHSTDPVVNMNSRSQAYPISCKITTDKFKGLDRGEIRRNLFRDEYIIRLPETILLRAEAKQRTGDKAGAAGDINLLRSRAQCSYLVTAADVDDNFNLILDERARELIYEEFRWNTLLRMGGTVAVDRIRKYAYWPSTQATLTFNYNLWPIPQAVIDVNREVILEQNQGWANR
jgi:tetratricopeptide (TPR) repeat protein